MPIWTAIVLIVLMVAFGYTTHVAVIRKELKSTKQDLLERKNELEYKLTKYSEDYAVKQFIEGEIAEINKDIAIIEKNYACSDWKLVKKSAKELFQE